MTARRDRPQAVQNRLKPGDGNAMPGRTIGCLVADLVQRLLEDEEVEQELGLGAILRRARSVADGVEVALEEGFLRRCMFAACYRLQLTDRIRLAFGEGELGGP